MMVSVSDTVFFTIFAFAFRLLTVHSASGFRAPHVHRSQFWTIHSAPLVLTSLSVYRALIVYFFIIARNFTLFFIQLISFSHFEKWYQIHIDYLFFFNNKYMFKQIYYILLLQFINKRPFFGSRWYNLKSVESDFLHEDKHRNRCACISVSFGYDLMLLTCRAMKN